MSTDQLFSKILVPIDGSEPSFHAARVAINIANKSPSKHTTSSTSSSYTKHHSSMYSKYTSNYDDSDTEVYTIYRHELPLPNTYIKWPSEWIYQHQPVDDDNNENNNNNNNNKRKNTWELVDPFAGFY